MADIGTCLVIACLVSGWAAMRWHGPRRFARGFLLIPWLLIRMTKFALLAIITIGGLIARAAPEVLGATAGAAIDAAEQRPRRQHGHAEEHFTPPRPSPESLAQDRRDRATLREALASHDAAEALMKRRRR